MDVQQTDLIEGAHWWELAGHHDGDALADTWRQVHYASQAVAELGKAWADERSDDSHSALIWVPDRERLHDQYFAGRLAEGERHTRAVLRPWDMRLFLIDAAGSPMASVELVGKTVADAIGWVRTQAEAALGKAKQAARPAPDLPEHALGDGAPFEEPNQLAVAEVIRLYSNTDALLAALATATGERETSDDGVLVWPHHFDIASLAVVATDGSGSMTRTIGVGLTPPDSLIDEGYWYVSPWSNEAMEIDGMPQLEAGRWIERGGSLPMAVLPVSGATVTEDPAAQHRRVAGFVASAYNACRRALADG